MEEQRIIIGCGIVIALVASINALADNRFNAKIIFGAGGIILILGLVTYVGPDAGKVASALAMLTATTVVLEQGGELFGVIQGVTK